MKVLSLAFLVVSCFVFSSEAQSPFDIGGLFRNVVERARARFQCGFKQLNLPSLDPLNLVSYSVFLPDIQIAQNVNITVSNVQVTGLSKFQLSNVNFNVFTGTLSFKVVHPELVIKGTHVTTGVYNGAAFRAAGSFGAVVRNIQINPTITFSVWPRVEMTSHTAVISIGSAESKLTGFGSAQMDQQINFYLSAGTPSWVANNQPFVNAEITKVAQGYVNGLLSSLNNLTNVINALISYNPVSGCQ